METPSGEQTTAPPPQQPPHVVIFPTPGIGHLLPLTLLAKRLLPHFTFTFAVPTGGASPSAAERALLSSLPTAITAVFLPPVDLSDVAPQNSQIITLLSLTLLRSLPSLRCLLAARRAATLVVDLFGTDAFDVAREFNLRPYLFFPTTAMVLSMSLHLEKLTETTSHPDEPVFIPGCKPVRMRDLPKVFHDRESEEYKGVLHHTKRYTLSEGIIVNSFEGIEEGVFEELMRSEPGMPPVYPIGPVVRTGLGQPSGSHDCAKWLDEQPRGSVLYVSFGSGGALNVEQQNELALGLEMSRQRFIWVARKPNDFHENSESDSMSFLPEGFLGRTTGRGLVVRDWAPQIEILSHDSTGGFLTHCGWNSVLESMVHEVPVVAWPLYAEQGLNSVLLVEDMNVGLKPSRREDGVIQADEIARVVTNLMEGDEGKRVRRRMEEMKKAALVAVSEDGSSTRALNEIATIWKGNV